MKKKSLQTGFGGTYDKGENLIAAQWAMDSNVRHPSDQHSSADTDTVNFHFLVIVHIDNVILLYFTIVNPIHIHQLIEVM